MTDISPLVPAGRQVINSYGSGRFRVSGELYQGSVIVFPDRTVALAAAALDDLTVDHLRPVMEARPGIELLLVGSGHDMRLLPAALRGSLRQAGVAVETMATGPACRTYNVLMAEDRRVAAALIAIT